MIVESPTGMPSEDSTKAGLPILWVPAAGRFAVNARFVAAGSGAVSRCGRRLPRFAAFASPRYPSPEIGRTRCSQPPPPFPAFLTSRAARDPLNSRPVKTTPKCPWCSGKTVRHPPHSGRNPPMGHRCCGHDIDGPPLRWPGPAEQHRCPMGVALRDGGRVRAGRSTPSQPAQLRQEEPHPCPIVAVTAWGLAGKCPAGQGTGGPAPATSLVRGLHARAKSRSPLTVSCETFRD